MGSVLICAVSVRVTLMSEWEPDSAVRQAWQVPQPPRSHSSAAAKASAALDRPDPGGPVKSQAWPTPRPSAAFCTASCSTATTLRSPTRLAMISRSAII